MRKSMSDGYIEMTSSIGEKYINFGMAVLAAQSLAYAYATQGYLTTTSCDQSNGRAEVTVHFNEMPYPKPIPGIKPTYYRITSQQYFCSHRNEMQRVRCKSFYFLTPVGNE